MGLPIEVILIGLFALAAIGWVSGFLGIGGGFLLIPLFEWIGVRAGLTGELPIKQAMGTALLVSSMTALSGYFVHRGKSDVPADSVFPLAAGVGVGAFLGARTAAHLLGTSLYPLFGAALLISAGFTAFRRERGREDEFPRGAWLLAVGLPIGFAAAVVGLGGAVFTGLMFSGILGFPIRRVATATSLAQVVGGVLGAIGFAWEATEGVAGLAPGSIGYVNVPVGLIALLLTWPIARLGAAATHRASPRWVRGVFAVLLVGLAVRFFLRG